MSSKPSRIKRPDKSAMSGCFASTQRYSQMKLTENNRRPGTRGELGAMFEKKLNMLALFRALKEEYDFTLDTNIDGVGAFDDIVFTYKESDGIEQRIFLQAKHKEDENKKIYFEDFLKSGNDDFALYKYFIDYMEIMRNFNKKNKIKNKYFIIYTNIGIHCHKADDEGLRICRKSKDEYFIFKKLDLSSHRPLEIFSTVDSQNAKKYPVFYHFSEKGKSNADEKSRVINVLKSKFKIFDCQKKDPKLTTVSENELESMLEGYLNTLIFAVHQHNEKNLGNLIKVEIKKAYTDSLSQDQVDFIFEYALNEIGQWKHRSKAGPLTEKDDFFKQGKMKFINLPALYPTLVYENELGISNLQFIKRKYEELSNFISSEKQLWLISSNTSWLNSLVLYQALNEDTLKKNTGINYANHDHHLFITWSDLLKGYEFILTVFEAMGQSLLIIACESTNPVNPQTSAIANRIVKIISAANNNLKQVIVIAPENFEFSVLLTRKLTSSFGQEHKVEFCHLTPGSQETCLTTKKIRLQGKDEQFSIQQLLGLEEQFPVPEEILTKLNLGISELETLLKSQIVEIGDEQTKLSDLDSAHYKTYTQIALGQLKRSIIANPGDIFTFVGEQNEIKSLLQSFPEQVLNRFECGLSPKNGGFILLKAVQEGEQFKQLCNQVDEIETSVAQPALHLLKKWDEQWVWTRTYSRDFYMDRYLHPVIVDKKKVKDDIIRKSPSFDFIVFSGTDEAELLMLLNVNENEKIKFRKNTAIFLEEEAARKKFEHLSCDLNQNGKSIHWLKIEDVEGNKQKQLQWYRSQGEVSRLRQVLANEGEVKATLREASLAKSTERVIVLADEPGMGKTTTLARVAELLKKEKPESWVTKIDLNRHQVVLTSKQVKTVEDFVDLLSNIDRKLTNSLARRILMYQLTCPGYVALLWDGFDEVKSERQDAVLALFEFLKKETAATVWVTTRRHDQLKLEERLSVLAHPFEPLGKAKQIDFLSRFWATTLKLSGKIPDSSILKSYAEEVIQSLEQSLKSYQADNIFISIPLRARMLAEIYQDIVEKAHMENKPPSQFLKEGKQFSLGNLYKQFIIRKYDIYLREKAVIGEGLDEESKTVLMKSYTKAYGLLAMQKLFDPLFIRYKKIKYSSNILSRIGLIQGNEQPINFIHRTFAEYFAGKWLAKKVKCLEVKKFIGFQLFKEESGVVRRFFDYFLTKNLHLHSAVLGDLKAFHEALGNNPDVDSTDELGRTVLHLAAQEGRHEMVQYLHEVCDHKLVRDHVGKTALHYAARFGYDKVVHQFLENHIDIDLDDHIFRAPLHFDAEVGNSIFRNVEFEGSKLLKVVNEQDDASKTPLYYAADNAHWETSCSLILYGADVSVLTIEQKKDLLVFAAEKMHYCNDRADFFRPVVGLLSIQVPEAVQGMSDDYEYPRLLRSFFLYGHTKVIDALLRSIGNTERRKNIANSKDNSTPLLNFLNVLRCSDKYSITDADYLKIVRYFFEQGRDFGIKVDETNVIEILHNAAQHSFLETFKYLYEYGENRKCIFPLGVIGNCSNVIRLLLSNIQDINSDSPWLQNLISATFKSVGWTRLHLAGMNKNVNSVEDFLLPPVYQNINRKDKFGNTALLYATFTPGRSKFIESLFSALKTRKLNDRNQLYEIVSANKINNGMTSLHGIIDNADFDSGKVLLKNIQEIGFTQEQLFNIFNSRDFCYLNPLGYIYSGKWYFLPNTLERNCQFIELLFKYMKSFNFSSYHYREILQGIGRILRKLIKDHIEEGALTLLNGLENLPLEDRFRAEIVNSEIDTSLHEAASIGYYRIVLSLLKNGAVFNALSFDQKTPLDLFVKKKREGDGYQKTEFLLNSVDRLFELVGDGQNIQAKKLDELKKVLNELKKESWIDPGSILKARNRQGKTLLDLSKYHKVTRLLKGLLSDLK